MRTNNNNNKYKNIMRRLKIYFAAVLIGISLTAYSQNETTSTPKEGTTSATYTKNYAQHRFHVYYGAGYSNDIYSRINNEFIHNNFSCSHMLEARYAFFFAPKWGLSVGAGVSQFMGKGTLNIKGVIADYYDPAFNPSGQASYDLHYTTSNFVEQQRIWALEVPLQFHFEHRAKARRPGVFASLGAKGYFPLISAKSIFPQDNGSLTTSGYEEFTNTWYTDAPHFGEQNIRLTPSATKLRLSVDALADVGMIFRLGCAWDLYLGVYGSYGFMDILPEAADKIDVITSEPSNPYTLNSLLGSNFLGEYNNYIDKNNSNWEKVSETWNKWQVGIKIGIHLKPHEKCLEKQPKPKNERNNTEVHYVLDVNNTEQAPAKAYRDTVYVYVHNVVQESNTENAKPTPSEELSIAKLAEVFKDVKILFDLNSDVPKIDNKNVIVEAANALKNEPSLLVMIEGYTCDLGTAEHNRELAARRAEAIRQLFIAQGANPAQLQTAGYTSNDFMSQLNIKDEQREEHRAVIFRIYIRK